MKKSPSGRENIEDAYPLSPMQEGMLFHTLYAPDSGVYYEQIRYRIGAPLDEEHMRAAWQGAVDRHSALRTVFAWRNVERPLQVVARKMELDWRREKISGDELEKNLRAEITRGFELSRAPLFRVRLYETLNGPGLELVIAFHHILLDMWSYSLIEKEVFADYRARLRGNTMEFRKPRPFKDFIQRSGLGSADATRNFWREGLLDFRGGTAPAELPDESTSDEQDSDALTDFGEVVHAFTRTEGDALRTFAREHHLTLNTLLSGAWALLLRRHTRENDVLFGMTVSGRPADLTGFEAMTGLFINTLPVRVRLDDDESPAEFLRRLQKEQGPLRDYEDTPLARIAEWCGFSENRSLFESIIVVENMPASVRAEDNHGLRIESVTAFEKTNYPLTIVFHPGESSRILIKYDGKRYGAFAARSLMEQLTRILAWFVESRRGEAGTPRRLRDFSLQSSEAHARILTAHHEEAAADASSRLLHVLFSRTAARFAERPALSFQGRTLSYAELEERSNALAHLLREAGVKPETTVGLYMGRSPELIIAILAALKAGAGYLPLDPDYPAERIAYIIADARPPLVVVNGREEKSPPLELSDGPSIVDMADDRARSRSTQAPRLDARENNLAYIIYTSGSTGKPKGVMVEHGHVADLFASTLPWARMDEHDVWTMYHSASFDFSVWEIWGALLFGGRLEIVDYWTSRSPADMAALIRRENVTVFSQTPSAFQRFMEEDGEYPALRLVTFGGEALDFASLSPWFEKHGERTELVNMFGITETIVHVTHHKVSPRDTRTRRGNIGRPLAGKRVYVLDEFMNPVPEGVPGEIIVGGKGVARGYLNRPELTAERFVPDPFAPDMPGSSGAVMYRSGDLGRRLPDGNLEYLGRVDDQVKIRGFRIEPGEIESALREHSDVQNAVVMARSNVGDKYLACYYIATREIETEELRNFLARRLPEHMLPARYVPLRELPLTRNGKVDKQALPEPGFAASASENHQAPVDDLEKTLAAIWSEILKVRNPGRHDDFFQLGGDSILSIRMVSRAAKEGLKFSPRDVFEKSTIARLSELLRDSAPVTSGPAAPKPDLEKEIELPLTPILRWFTELRLPNPNHYNMVFALRPRRRLKPELCERALDIIVARHDALRLRLRTVSGGEKLSLPPRAESISPSLRFERFTSGEENLATLERIAGELQEAVDMGRAVLIQAAYIQGAQPEDDRLLTAIHHIAVDGVGWRILLEDFDEIYTALEKGTFAEKNHDGLSFAEWAKLESTPTTEFELEYWLRQKNGHASPRDMDGKNVFASEKIASRKLDPDLTQRLTRDIPAGTDFRVQEILAGALVQVLSEWTGDSEVVLQLESHGRNVARGPDPSGTMGWFTALYPVKFKAHENTRQTSRATRKTMRGIPNQGSAYGKLKYDENVGKSLRESAEPDIVFNYLGDFRSEGLLEFASEQPRVPRDAAGTRPHALEINCFIRNDELHVNLHYSENLHTADTAARLADGFIQETGALLESELAEAARNVFALSPAQAGMLAESIFLGEGDMHVEQIQVSLRGPADGAALNRAWRMVLEENPALRGGFLWRDELEPLQFIAEDVDLDLEILDLSADADAKTKLTEYLRAAREKGFDFHNPPLMRAGLIRLGPEEHVLAWTFHHILMDGWCLFPVLRRVFALYAVLREGGQPERVEAPSYRDYIAWLGRRDDAEAAAFFRGKLKDFRGPSSPGRPASRGVTPKKAETKKDEARHARRDLKIRPAVRLRLLEFARENRLTLNTVLQGLWALVLARYNASEDVTFGVTVSGRPPALDGVEKTIGLFINTLPVRVNANTRLDVVEMLKEIQDYNLALREFEYSSGADVREWSGLPAGGTLFESILVYENYPFEPESFEAAGLLFDMESLESTGATTAYALTLLVMPGRELALRAICDTRRMTSSNAERILEHLALVMNYLAATPAARIGECLALIAEEEIPVLSAREAAPFAEPRGETEIKLAGLFREILGTKKIGRHDDFFALGGQSMLALRLAAGIRAIFGREIRVTSLLAGGSIAELAPLLDDEDRTESKDAVLVPIKTRGAKPPLFLVHPAGASPLCYGVPARLLGDDQPVYGLQPRGLEDDEPFLTSIEDMAEHYIRRIREKQSDGPYRLGGWSLGGIIAYEMAQQLNDRGREVEFLGMIDVSVEDHGDNAAWLFLKAAAFALKSITEQDLPRGWKEWRHLLGFVGVELPEDPLEVLTHARLPDAREWGQTLKNLGRVLARFYPIYLINMIAPMLYKPRPWPGQADLFRVPPYFWENPDPIEKKLREYARGGVRVHPIAGNHMTLMNLENAPVLAAQLRARLEEL